MSTKQKTPAEQLAALKRSNKVAREVTSVRNGFRNYEKSKEYQEKQNYKEKTGYDCALWLVEHCLNTKEPLPEYLCHSMNPVGKTKILGILDNYTKQQKFKNAYCKYCEHVIIDRSKVRMAHFCGLTNKKIGGDNQACENYKHKKD